MSARRAAMSPRVILLIAFAHVSVINYAFGLVAARLLAPGDFGLLAFAQTVLLVAGLVLNSGFARALAIALVKVQGPRQGALIRGAIVANLALACGLSLIIVLLFVLGPLKPGFETGTTTALVALTLPVLAFEAIVAAAAQGTARFGAMALTAVVEVAGKAIGGIAFVYAGFGAAGAVAGFLVGALISSAVGLWILLRVLGVRPWGVGERSSLRVAQDMFGATLGLALLLNLDLFAVKLFSGSDRAIAGAYQASSVLATTPYYLAAALVPILFTQVARVERLALTGTLVAEAVRLTLLVLIPIELVLVTAPELALGVLFRRAYTIGAPALPALAAGNGAIILVLVLSTAFQATTRGRVPARILFSVTACEALALRVIVPIWRAEGAAATFLAATAVTLALLAHAYARELGWTIGWPAVRWLGRYSIALASGLLVETCVLRVGHNSVGAVGLGGICYLGAVVLLGLSPMAALGAHPGALRRASAAGE